LRRGSATIKAEFDGVTYRFFSEDNKALFLKSPEKWVPQYGGFCANGIMYGIPWGGDGDQWKLVDGKLYIFGGAASRNYFLMYEKRNLPLAERYWNDEVKGRNALIQRYKRLVLRVPHYQTGAELEAEWQKSRQNGGVPPLQSSAPAGASSASSAVPPSPPISPTSPTPPTPPTK
jgi:YHS domain-containing protein